MKSKSECCGCSACEQICPVGCINMKEDEEGFLYPKIDETKCIHCKKCEKVCPIRYPNKKNKETKTYVAYAKDEEIRKKSSSGGIFSLLAKSVLLQNGVVFGAAFDTQFQVHHIGVTKIEELEKLRGSKYLQSRVEHTFCEAENYLKEGKLVLYSGTACQIEGLQKYLGKSYENLLTIDVLCHGVPSPKIWKLYLKQLKTKYDSKIEKVHFRNKKDGWKKYSILIRFENAKKHLISFKKDKFMKMFLSNINLRPSCHNCQFKAIPRSSDITLGDCWGIEDYMPEMDDDGGTSVILVHTVKGEEQLKKIKELMIYREAELDKALPPVSDSRKSVRTHPNRKKYWNALLKEQKTFEELYEFVEKSFLQKVIGVIINLVERLFNQNK